MDRDPTARTLLLLSLLQSGTERSGAELARRLGVSARTVRRDAERLRRLGYAVDARPGPGSAYRLGAGVRVPPLLLEEDEVTAVVTGLRWAQAQSPDDDAAARALCKLTGVLPPALRRRAAATDLATEVLDAGRARTAAHAFGAVADAIAEDGRVSTAYVDQRGRPSRRLLDPYRLVLGDGRWYLVAWDVDRDDWRTFRFDRVEDVTRVPGVFRRRRLPASSIRRWFATDFGRVP